MRNECDSRRWPGRTWRCTGKVGEVECYGSTVTTGTRLSTVPAPSAIACGPIADIGAPATSSAAVTAATAVTTRCNDLNSTNALDSNYHIHDDSGRAITAGSAGDSWPTHTAASTDSVAIEAI